ncbi:MAG: hypothetical protein ACD_23C00676G0002 [uncultured bacterium]|nr:MAG: hypothetical protein ACD_23C00676G0002 [uncultured bacterium]
MVNAVVVHATARMAGILISPVQLVMLGNKAQPQHPGLQVSMARSSSALASIGLEIVDLDAQGHTSLATVAVGAVCEHAATPEPLGYQVRVDIGLNQMAGRGDL